MRSNQGIRADYTVALAGNPNVGKSTVFNALTGSHQHTGNWPGKTVERAEGLCTTENYLCKLIDLPGTYSLLAHSPEEEVARDYLCFDRPDTVVVVCDATCLERNLNLVLQVMELTPRVLVCVNLMDEAKRKGITVDLKELSALLGVPVVGTQARKRSTLTELKRRLDGLLSGERTTPMQVNYPPQVELALSRLRPLVEERFGKLPSRWLALRLLEGERPGTIQPDGTLTQALERERESLREQGLSREVLQERIVSTLVKAGERVARSVVRRQRQDYLAFDRRLDRLLTSRATGYPVMLALLALIFWITIQGANYPSEWLSTLLFWLQDRLLALLAAWHAPEWLRELLVLGVYRTLAWVVSVMLPPMLIFFPLFTLLEDVGYLPRVAYNLDRPYQRCHACGKQSLTHCMGFGCNAVGVTGCRIIDSPRERLLAILTNTFAPCNGRFPALISLITMFFVGGASGALGSVCAAALLTGVIAFGLLVSLGVTRLLSATLLKGMPSSFVLEMPPYRRPQIGKVLVRSVWERALFVLGRAVTVAAPAGLVLWLLANLAPGGVSLLARCAGILDPAARYMGLDGVILLAFILGFPANEIVLPIVLMGYLAQGTLVEPGDLTALHTLLVAQGWTWQTAGSFILFSLCHWPCSTTVLTIRKETGSWKWAGLGMLIPTAVGVLICCLFTWLFG